MQKSIIHIFFIIFISQTVWAISNNKPFIITDDTTAKKIESEIDSYPNQIKFNLLYKLSSYYEHSNIQKTIDFSEKNISLIIASKNSKYNNLLFMSYIMLGNMNTKIGSHSIASDLYLLALNVDIDKNNIARFNTLNLLGTSLIEQQNYYASLQYLREAFSISKILDHPNAAHPTMLNMANAFTNLNRPDSAIYYLNKVLHSNASMLSKTKANISFANVVLLSNNLRQATEYIDKAIKLALQLNNEELCSMAYITKAKILAIEKKFNQSESYITKAHKLTYNDKNIQHLLGAAQICELNNNPAGANLYYKKFITQHDSISKQLQRLSTLNFNKQFEILKQKREISHLKVSNYQREIDVKKNRFLIIISLTLVFLLIVATYFVINYHREKNKNLRIISKQNEELTLKKHKEDIRKMELKTAIAQLQGQEIERERLAKELHDGVGGTLAGIKMELESFFSKTKKNEKTEYLLKSLNNTYNEVRSISKNLTLPNFMSESLGVNISELIENFPGKGKLNIDFNAFPEDDWDDISFDRQKEVYRMIQEAITNVIKHSKATELDIQVVNDGQSLSLIMEDNGIGFDMNGHWKGIGLKNMYSRASVLKGSLLIESEPGEGTSLNLNIPLNN